MKPIVRSVKNNPMLYEWTMIKRRMHPSNWKANTALGYAIVAVLYAGLFYVVIQSARNFEPLYLFFPMMLLPILILPVVMHGAIAGERQNRSLEMLFAAPVTPAQIVVGKSLRAVPAVASVMFGCGILMILLIGTRAFQTQSVFIDVRSGPLIYLLGIVGTITLLWMVTGMTMWVSTVSKSIGSALMGSMGMMILTFVIVPSMVFPLISLTNPQLAESLFVFNPVGFLVNLLDLDRSSIDEFKDTFGLLALVVWFVFGSVFFRLAVGRLGRDRMKGEGG